VLARGLNGGLEQNGKEVPTERSIKLSRAQWDRVGLEILKVLGTVEGGEELIEGTGRFY